MSESMKSRKNNELSDAELNQVQGGLGVYSGYMCKKCPDSSTFKRYFTTRPNNGCPNYQPRYGERGRSEELWELQARAIRFPVLMTF